MIIEVDDWEDWEHVNLSEFTNTIKTVPDAELLKQMEERKLEERKLVEESDQILVHELFEEASTTQPVKMPITITPTTSSFTTITPIKSPTSSEMTAKSAKKSNYRLEHELKQKAHAKKVLEFAIKQKKVAEIYGKASEIDKYDEYDAKFY
jgi:hypothetical protein